APSASAAKSTRRLGAGGTLSAQADVLAARLCGETTRFVTRRRAAPSASAAKSTRRLGAGGTLSAQADVLAARLCGE
ncbi:hypothetical protein, partial [Cronobacter malonaticus]|uniref:hypothetical protein n=1 Tax=Cronobacter malonaticus TaxID=413503 RepID=UPI001F23109A